MGKRIIIKGADFSTNGINVGETTWYFNSGFANDNQHTAVSASSAWAQNDTDAAVLYGKTINRIKFMPAASGTFHIYKTSSLSSLGELVATLTISGEKVGTAVTAIFDDVLVAQGERFVFPDIMNYATKSGASFYKRVGYRDNAIVSGYQFPWAFGYYSENE